MQLPKHAGKRRFASLIGSGNNDDPLLAAQVKAIADNWLPFAGQLQRKCDIEAVAAVDVLRIGRYLGKAELQSGSLELGHLVEIRNIKLNLSVKSRNRPVEKVGMASAITQQA